MKQVLLPLMVSLLWGCASEPTRTPAVPPPLVKPAGANLDSREAIRLAQRTLRKEGIGLERYHSPNASYNAAEGTWLIHFEGKVAMPGNHSSVEINDKTGKTRLWRGE